MMPRIAVALAVGLALTACAGASAPGAGGSGVQGSVVLAPACPVEVEGSPCPATPVATTVRVLDEAQREVTSVRTGSDGRFRVELEPGDYVLEPDIEGTAALSARPVAVTVEPEAYARVRLTLDTGVRTPGS